MVTLLHRGFLTGFPTRAPAAQPRENARSSGRTKHFPLSPGPDNHFVFAHRITLFILSFFIHFLFHRSLSSPLFLPCIPFLSLDTTKTGTRTLHYHLCSTFPHLSSPPTPEHEIESHSLQPRPLPPLLPLPLIHTRNTCSATGSMCSVDYGSDNRPKNQCVYSV